MLGTNPYTLTTLKIDLSNHLFIKDDIFEANVNLPPRGTPIGIVSQYCEHHNISYITPSTNKRPWNHALTSRHLTNAWIIIIVLKLSSISLMSWINNEPTIVGRNYIYY